MKAILYVAGRGRRLGEDRPKVLLDVGGRSLLARHAERLVACGADELVLITGYQEAAIKEAMATISAETGLAWSTIHNPDFLEGSLLSFAVSLPAIEDARGPILLMDGDVLYPQAMLDRLVSSPHATCLLYDREYSTADDDPVLVPLMAGKPFEFQKGWSGEADQVGESIGFFKIGVTDRAALIEETRRQVGEGQRDRPFEEVFRALVKAGRFGAEDVSGWPWTEIDFPGDLSQARNEVLPAVEALERGERGMGVAALEGVPADAIERGGIRMIRRQLGQAAGAEALGCSVLDVPPGARSWPFHYHAANEEGMFVLEGRGKIRLGEGELRIESGDYIALPVGPRGAHQLINDGAQRLRVLCASTMLPTDITVYPDSGKVGLFGGSAPGGDESVRFLEGFYPRSAPIDYWLGEGGP